MPTSNMLYFPADARHTLQKLCSIGSGKGRGLAGIPASPLPYIAPLGAFFYLIYLVRDQTVRLAVDGCRRFRVGGIYEAEDLPLLLVYPVAQVSNTICVLRL